MQRAPQHLSHFQKTMAAALAVERQWHVDGFASIYPFADLATGAPPKSIVLVEVGGGHGHVVRELRVALPAFRGRMVLEDLPAVVDSAPPQDEVEYIPYNFLTSGQPIQGACAYLFRHVLLDWSDARLPQNPRAYDPSVGAGLFPDTDCGVGFADDESNAI